MKKIVFVTLIITAAVLVYFSRSSKPTDESKTKTESTEHDDHGHGKAGFTRATRPSGEEIPAANEDIAQLRALLQANNYDGIEGLLAKMAIDLKAQPERLDEILQGLKTEIDPRLLTMLTRIILEGGAITNQVVVDTALELAKNDSVEPRRHASLYLLGEVPNVTPEMAETVVNVSRDAKETLVRTSALATMADWMKNNPQLKTELSGEILKTIQSTDTLEVRANGLLFVANHLQDLPENFTTEMIGFLQDSSHYNRSAAARALAKLPEKRDVVVPLIELALSNERNADARRLMLDAIVFASTIDSRPILQKYENDPDLKQHVRDYYGILDGGTIDPKEIAMKKERIDVQRNPPVIEKH